MIKCQCGKIVFDGVVLKIRVAQFSKGHMNLKCPQCRAWLNGLPVGLLTGEIQEDIDFSNVNKEVCYHDPQRSHNQHSQRGI